MQEPLPLHAVAVNTPTAEEQEEVRHDDNQGIFFRSEGRLKGRVLLIVLFKAIGLIVLPLKPLKVNSNRLVLIRISQKR